MNTQELRAAIISYPVGTKFSHPYFSDDEYIISDENCVAHTEDGYECSPEFWEIRKDWDGWYIKEDDTVIPFSLKLSDPDKGFHTEAYEDNDKATVYCEQCKLLKEDKTCPYSRKPIKLIAYTTCKYGISKF